MNPSGSLPRWLVPAVAAGVLAPLVVAVLAQRNAHWHPVFDLAMTELRVRDVGGGNTPLIGLQGRIGPSGSHPGPLSFYLLAPVYRLLGSSSFALQASTAVFHGAGALTALLVVRRRRDPRLVVAVGVVLLLLMQGYGLGPLTEPWNPHLPVIWFVAFLVSVWAVVDGDSPMLVPAVLAGSICAQTHVPYLAVTLGIGGAAVAALTAQGWQRGRQAQAFTQWRWLVMSAAFGAVLWLPPVIDQVVHEPGNFSQLVDHLATPAEDPIGLREAAPLMLERLDAWQLLVAETAHPGTYIRVLEGPGPTAGRGLATLVIWVVTVGVAVALRHHRLLTLHAVVGVSALVGWVAISRIFGVPWYYLMLWAFGIGALMVLAIAATAAVAIGRTRFWIRMWPTSAALASVALVVTAGISLRLIAVAPDATTATPAQTAQLARLVPDTAAALTVGEGAASGRDGRYFVEWDDAVGGGGGGIGLVNELIRRGFDVGVGLDETVRVGAHRVLDPADATARVVLASGGWVEHWASQPGAQLVAFDDPRSAEERREFAQVRRATIERLDALGRADLKDKLDTDLLDVALNGGIPAELELAVARMLDIGVASAVFVLPPEEPA